MIYITGVAGFLGSHLADQFEDVRGCDDLSGGDLDNVPSHVEFENLRCQDLVPGDFEGVECVYHCAALAHEGLSVFSPRLITESVFGASISVFSAAIAAGVKRIVYCSSMARYGGGAVPFLEVQAPRPVDPYGIAKVASEEVLFSLSQVHNFEYIVAVPHNIIGPRQKYDDPFRNVASIMANRMLQGKQPIIYGSGTQVRCFSDVRDVIPIFVQMADHDGRFYNVGPDEEPVTILELFERLAHIIGFQESPIFVPDRPCEVHEARCSSMAIREDFGYETRYSLDQTLTSIVEWIKEKGPKPFKYHLPIELSGAPRAWTERML